MPARHVQSHEAYLNFLADLIAAYPLPAPFLPRDPDRVELVATNTARPASTGNTARPASIGNTQRPRRGVNTSDDSSTSNEEDYSPLRLPPLLADSYTDSSSGSDGSSGDRPIFHRRRNCPFCRGAHGACAHAPIAPIGTRPPSPPPFHAALAFDLLAGTHRGTWFARRVRSEQDEEPPLDFAALDDLRNPIDDVHPSERILFQPGLRVDAPPPYHEAPPPPPAYDEPPPYAEHDLLGLRGGRAEWWVRPALEEMGRATRAEESAFGAGWSVVPRRLRQARR